MHFGIAIRSATFHVVTSLAGMAGSAGARRARSALMHPGCAIEQVYLCREPIGFRKSINGLGVLVEQALGLNVCVPRSEVALAKISLALSMR